MTQIRVLGCSDAFSSGGRLFPCFHVESGPVRFLIDCGPTALLGMKREALDVSALDAVLISHFHGDHIGGLPFLELELGIVHKRQRPLLVAGPPGMAARAQQLMDALYPGIGGEQRAPLEFVEWPDGTAVSVGGLRVTPFATVHTPESRPFALRIETGAHVIGYSGDSEWTESLVAAAAEADLFICEATSYEAAVPSHLTYREIVQNRERLRCRRLLLTHMNEDTLAHALGYETAHDGMRITL